MTKLKGLGGFDGITHVLPISVYYEDTDLSGVVYHANYLRYMERGRTEFFRFLGVARAALDINEPSAWALTNIAVQYRRPARLDDQLVVRSTLTGLSGARLNVWHQVMCGDVLLVEGRVEACMITLKGRPLRIPQKIAQTLAPFVAAAET